MKRAKAKILIMMILSVMLVLGFTACGGSEDKDSGGESGGKDKETGAPIVSEKDISYEIGNARFDDYRAAAVTFTNNTDYDIISFDMIFEVSEKAKEVKGESISTSDDALYLVKSGETSPYLQVYDDATYEGISPKVDLKSNIEPDTLTIIYKEKDSNKVFEMTHDYINNKTSYEKSDYVFNKWDNKLAKNYPKPESDNILIKDDSESDFEAIILDGGKSDWEKYAKECYKAGLKAFSEKYTEDSYYGDDSKNKTTVNLEFEKEKGYSIEIRKDE